MRLRRCLLTLLLCSSLPTQAARFEGYSGAWLPSVNGTLRNGPTTYDLDKTLGLDPEASHHVLLYFAPQSHWYWPDLSASYTHLGGQGNGRAASVVQVFGPLTVPANSMLFSTISINDYDLSADIPFDFWRVHFGAGVTVKYLVGNVTVNTLSSGDVAGVPVGSVSGTSVSRVNQVFPLAHLRAATDVFSWLSLVGSGNYITYDSNRAYELRGQVDVRPLDPVTLSVGYLRKSYLVNRNTYRLDTDVDGIFFGVGLVIR